ncbi:MAG: S41 family peptidase [Planctomycetota bacterium]|nr:S41 family peptidase [Planctomycetota bacterium]MDA1105821.1 S41 family peptidase [Planctomycetota bacterium]
MQRSRRLVATIPLFVLVATVGARAQEGATVDLPRLPSVSPDGSTIAFSWHGDLWKAATSGGQATRLTATDADEWRTSWSADGRTIAFGSDQFGSDDLFVMDINGGAIRQVSFDDASLSLSGFGRRPGGEEALFFDASREGDFFRGSRPYWLPLEGGIASRVHDAFGTTPQPSPDGSAVLYERGGNSWGRRHYRGPGQRDIWLFRPADGTHQRLTDWAGNDGWASFIDADEIAFLSDRELDTVNLYRATLAPNGTLADVRQLTAFDGRDIRDLSVSADGSTAVFVNWDTMYAIDLCDPKAQARAITVTAAEPDSEDIRTLPLVSKASESALSPDGKTMAIVAEGEVFVRPLDNALPARRVTDSIVAEGDLAWSIDGSALYFTTVRDNREEIWKAEVTTTRGDVKKSLEEASKPTEEPAPEAAVEPEEPEAQKDEESGESKDGPKDEPEDEAKEEGKEKDKDKEGKKEVKPKPGDRWQQALTFSLSPVVQREEHARDASPSPDGKTLAFRLGRGTLVLRTLESGEDRTLVSGWSKGLEWQWSADGSYVIYVTEDRDNNSDIWLVRADGSQPAVNVSRHPDNDSNPSLSADGKLLAYLSERSDEQVDAYIVFLDRSLESLPEHELKEYFKRTTDAAKKRKAGEAVTPNGDAFSKGWSLDDAYRRARRITSTPGNERGMAIVPSGEFVVYMAADGSGLTKAKWDGSEPKKIAGALPRGSMHADGNTIVGVLGGKAVSVSMGGEVKTVELPESIRFDAEALARAKWDEFIRVFSEGFYDEHFKGTDWPALAAAYGELAARSRTPEEFDIQANRLLGELNASHTGVRSPSGPRSSKARPGALGVQGSFSTGGYAISRVLDRGPASAAQPALVADDRITAVAGMPADGSRSMELLLADAVGKETIVDVTRRLEDGREIAFRSIAIPVTPGSIRRLLHDEQLDQARARVEELSNGRLGYIAIESMSIPALEEFERDLYAAAAGKEGLIIDVRNNGGGHTADFLLASIMAQPHARTRTRGQPEDDATGYPQDRLYIQRYTLPMNMLCNEKSFSNAEITAHAFRTLARGTLVGEQTYGAVISTGGASLTDGTTVQIPGRGWYLPDGRDMENNGAMPHLRVPQTPQAESAGRDEQLDAAVKDLMSRLP